MPVCRAQCHAAAVPVCRAQCHAAAVQILDDEMGQGFWSDEAFREKRGKTQGGKKTSIIKAHAYDRMPMIACL